MSDYCETQDRAVPEGQRPAVMETVAGGGAAFLREMIPPPPYT